MTTGAMIVYLILAAVSGAASWHAVRPPAPAGPATPPPPVPLPNLPALPGNHPILARIAAVGEKMVEQYVERVINQALAPPPKP